MTINIVHHKTILVNIIKNIYSNAILTKSIGFKGGTAAMLFYDLNRFSVDLDFDLLDETHKDYIFLTLENILKQKVWVKTSLKTDLIFLLNLSLNLEPEAQ